MYTNMACCVILIIVIVVAVMVYLWKNFIGVILSEGFSSDIERANLIENTKYGIHPPHRGHNRRVFPENCVSLHGPPDLVGYHQFARRPFDYHQFPDNCHDYATSKCYDAIFPERCYGAYYDRCADSI